MVNTQIMEAQVLAEMSETIGPINDVLEIDAENRVIIVPETELIFGVEEDTNVERKYFRCPRLIGDNIDLSKMTLRINFKNAISVTDTYIVEDVIVNGDYIEFSWLLSKKLLAEDGEVSFNISAIEVDDEGVETVKWSTTFTTGTVLAGLKVDDLHGSEEDQARDVLQQIVNIMNEQSATTVQNVKDEGAAQVANMQNEIDAKGAAVLDSIPADYTTLSNQVELNTRYSAPVIKQAAEGKSIVVNDSAMMHTLGLNVCGKSTQATTTGKNLLPNNAKSGQLKNSTFTINADRSVTVANTPTEACAYSIYGEYTAPISFPAGDYVLSGGFSENLYVRVRVYSSEGTYLRAVISVGDEKTLTINEGELISVSVYATSLFNGAATTVYPMLRLSSVTDNTYEPYTSGKASPSPEYQQEIVGVENPVISVRGKNLIPFPYMHGSLRTHNGVTYVVNDDGSVYASGTVTNTESYFVFANVNFGSSSVQIGGTNGTYCWSDCLYNFKNHYTMLYFSEGTTVDKTYYPQVELGIEPTEYQQYDSQEISVNNTLYGIPVKSDGNYVDLEGQQWICDEIDFERGVYIKRIGIKELDASSDEYWYEITSTGGTIYGHYISDALANESSQCIFCTHFVPSITKASTKEADACYFYNATFRICLLSVDTLDGFKEWLSSNPITVIYPLATPIETALSEEELLAYKALHTNYLTTNMLSDSEAHIKLVYAVDTKTYIDNKFAELSTTLSNNA